MKPKKWIDLAIVAGLLAGANSAPAQLKNTPTSESERERVSLQAVCRANAPWNTGGYGGLL